MNLNHITVLTFCANGCKTLAQIADHIGKSRPVTSDTLKSLVDSGALTVIPLVGCGRRNAYSTNREHLIKASSLTFDPVILEEPVNKYLICARWA